MFGMMMPAHFQTKSDGMFDTEDERSAATSDGWVSSPMDTAMVIYRTQVQVMILSQRGRG